MDILRFVDPANGSSRLDINGAPGSTTWQLGRGLDIGRQTLDKVYIAQPPFAGATLASSTPQLVRMVIPLFLPKQANVAAAKAKMVLLAAELNRTTNVIEMRLPGDASSVFLDTFRADLPSIVQGSPTPQPYAYSASVVPVVLEIDRLPGIRTTYNGSTVTYV